MGVFDKNKRKPGRKPYLMHRYWVAGKEIREVAKNPTNRKAAAIEHAEIRRQIKAGTWVHPDMRKGNRARFDEYARAVVARRVARKVATAATTERIHVETHLIPVFGKYFVHEMTFLVIKREFDEQINTKGLAGRYVRNIHSTLRAILIEAAEDELISDPPIPLSVKRDHLPPPVDKDPDFRESAQFDRDEIPALLAVESILSMRRVMYATYFLTGTRFKEIIPMLVRDRNRDMQPLASLSVHAVKVGRHKGPVGRRRHVPEHPELTPWLDWYLREVYEVLHGHKPRPDDLLFPTLSPLRRARGHEQCSHSEVYHAWARYDLPAAGLRHRRLHDARRTFLSALKNAGVDDELRRKLTHWSAKDRVLDAYTHWEWSTLCDAVKRINWKLPAPPSAKQRPGESNVVNITRRRRPAP